MVFNNHFIIKQDHQFKHVINLGPEGGDKGGEILAGRTPEEVAKNKKSYTGQYLKEYLRRN